MKIATIVPFYNEENNLKFFIKDWEKKISTLDKKYEFDFYFIDDGSTDSSSREIENSKDNLTKFIIKKKNTGHGLSCKYGYETVIKDNKYDFVFQLDSDNQCNPDYLDKFLLEIKNGNEFIFGHRVIREDGVLRLLSSKLLMLIFFLRTGKLINDLNCPYRMMSAKKLHYIIKNINNHDNIEKVILFNCLLTYHISKIEKITWIKMTFLNRKFGNTKYNFRSMFHQLLNLIRYV